MSLSNKLSITDVDLKGKRVLIRVRHDHAKHCHATSQTIPLTMPVTG